MVPLRLFAEQQGGKNRCEDRLQVDEQGTDRRSDRDHTSIETNEAEEGGEDAGIGNACERPGVQRNDGAGG